MPVYVSELAIAVPRSTHDRRLGWLWCRMFATSRHELLDLAERAGIPRSRYVARYRRHYELTPSLRLAAIEAGAVPIDGEKIVATCYPQRLAQTTGA